jgi:DNA primase
MDLEPKGIRKVLFRLPEVLAAVAAGRRIHVTEGENDVLPLVKHGFDATCNPGGASKWLDGHTQAMRGATVVIIADKDAPGRAAAGKVGGRLRAVAAA